MRPLFAIPSILVLTLVCVAAGQAWAEQRTFATADEAARAMVDAARADDAAALLALFGPEGEPLVSSGDPVRDRSERRRFAERTCHDQIAEHRERTGPLFVTRESRGAERRKERDREQVAD